MAAKTSFLMRICLAALLSSPVVVTAAPAEKADIETLRSTGEVFAEIAEKVSPAVVFISVEQEYQQQEYSTPTPFEEFNDEFFERFFRHRFQRERAEPKKKIRKGQGSGFIISDDGYILTNNHVVANADKITVKLADGRELTAKTIGTDPETDVALIKVKEEKLAYVELGDSDELKVGQWVLAIGNPFGFSHTVTAGIVSAKGRSRIGLTEYEDFIQTDAAINLGNSGGPLINIDGKVIGINSAIFSRSGGYMGIGFAIPINMAKYVYQQLRKDGSVTRGYLGITGKDVTPEIARGLGAKGYNGIVIEMIFEDSPAEKAGLNTGDIIIKLNKKDIQNWNNFRNNIAEIPPKTTIELSVVRNGKIKNIDINLGTRDSDALARAQETKGAKELGIQIQPLTEDLAARLRYKNETGVIVSEVQPYSNAAEAGISVGTLIKEVNRVKIENVEDFWQQVGNAEEYVLLYVRQGRYYHYVVVKFED